MYNFSWITVFLFLRSFVEILTQCPTVDPNFPGSCLSLCDDDSECTGGTLCCSNGCGFSCVPKDANGTSIGSKFLKQPKVPTTTTEKITTTDEEEEDTPTTTTSVKTTKKSLTAVSGASPVVSGCTKGSALRHTDGNILICGFSAGDFACPPTHSCTFDTTRGKFVCCLREGNAPVSVESQINPCPEGEPLANAAGGKLTCNGASTGPCPQGSFCIVGVCCPVAARTFAGGSNSDFSQKPGQCPVAQPASAANCPNECRFDGDCLGPAKCCFVSCGSKCTEPIPFGVDPNLPFNPNSFANNFPAGVERQSEPRQQLNQARFLPQQFNNNAQTQQIPNFGSSNGPDGGSFQSPNAVRFSNVPANFQSQSSDLPPQGFVNRNLPNGDNRQAQLAPNENRQGPFFNGDNRQGPFVNNDNRRAPFVNGDRQGSFQFAGNNAPTLNVPNQPNFNVPQPSVNFPQPSPVGISNPNLPPASQQFPQAPFPIPVPSPDFVPFPNGQFTNQNSLVPNSNAPQFGQVITPNVFARRNDSPNPQLQQQRPLAVISQKSERLIEVPQTKTASNDVCSNVQCPRCHRCNAGNGEPKCVRILDCCPDGTIPLGCAQNPCDFVRCPLHPRAHCVPDSCGICKAAFFDEEGNNVSCS